MREIWDSFVKAIVRFWDNRFQEKQNPELRALQIELEYKRRDYDKLFAAYQELISPKISDEKEKPQEYKPIRNYVPSWAYRAEQLERKHRAEKQDLTEKLERELEVNVPDIG